MSIPSSSTNHWFVSFFLKTMAGIFLLTILSFVFGLGLTLWLSVVAVAITVIAILGKVWSDNRHLRVTSEELVNLIATAFLLWLPFGLLLVPGALGARWLDNQLERGVSWIDQRVGNKVKEIEEVNERQIQESTSVFWNPWTWGTVVTKTIRETAVRQVLEKASVGTRFIFGLIYAVLRCVQYMYYAAFALVVIRSFGYVLARAAIRSGKGLVFVLPASN